MKNELLKAKEILLNGGHTCVFKRDEEIEVSDIRGVKPLLLRLESPQNLEGFYAADRVVGAAAAFLYVLLKAKAVYALILSKRAKEILEQNGIPFCYDELCEYVINRKGDGRCPMEEAVEGVFDAETALIAIKNKLEFLKNNP